LTKWCAGWNESTEQTLEPIPLIPAQAGIQTDWADREKLGPRSAFAGTSGYGLI
jgi:hypothetical protein